MANDKEKLEIKKKPQNVIDKELGKISGGDYLKCFYTVDGCVGSCYK